MKVTDALLLLLLAVLWGGSFLFIRVAVPGFGPAGLAALRVLLGATLLYGVARLLRRPVELLPHAGRLLVLGLLNAALPYLLISAAELRITAGFAAVLNATTPLFAATFGAVWLRERLTAGRLLGLVGGVAGVGVMIGWSPVPLDGRTLLAVAAMLAGSACYAGAGIYARLRLHGVPVFTLALGQQVGALAWLALPGAVWAPRALPSPAAAGAVLALGVLSTAVAYLLYFRLLERMGPTGVSTVTYLMPVAGITWGALFLRESVSRGMVVGLGLVLLSVLLVNRVRLGGLLSRVLPGARGNPPSPAGHGARRAA